MCLSSVLEGERTIIYFLWPKPPPAWNARSPESEIMPRRNVNTHKEGGGGGEKKAGGGFLPPFVKSLRFITISLLPLSSAIKALKCMSLSVSKQ